VDADLERVEAMTDNVIEFGPELITEYRDEPFYAQAKVLRVEVVSPRLSKVTTTYAGNLFWIYVGSKKRELVAFSCKGRVDA
jgi:hypothetical protein